MTKFDKLKRFILSRRTFRFGDVNKHFGLPVSSLNSYTTYLNYLRATGYVNKTESGVYSAADRKNLKGATVMDVKVRLRLKGSQMYTKALEKSLHDAHKEGWDLEAQLKMEKDNRREIFDEVKILLKRVDDDVLEIAKLKKENGEKMVAFAIVTVVAALLSVGLVISVFA